MANVHAIAAAKPANETATTTTNAIASSNVSIDSGEKTLVRCLADLITPRRRQSCGRSMFSRPLHQFAQPLRGRVPIELARSDVEDERFPFVGGQLVF